MAFRQTFLDPILVDGRAGCRVGLQGKLIKTAHELGPFAPPSGSRLDEPLHILFVAGVNVAAHNQPTHKRVSRRVAPSAHLCHLLQGIEHRHAVHPADNGCV